MKIDQIIEELQRIREAHGNLDCVIEGEWENIQEYPNISVVDELSVDNRLFVVNGEPVYLLSVLFMV